jgi:hypothetical protein
MFAIGRVINPLTARSGFHAAQLTSEHVRVDGISLPTKRRAYTRGPDRRPILDMLMVTFDFSDVKFS